MKKLLPLFTMLLTGFISHSQCNELFFSEYIEGSSSNKAFEIYNPTGSTIDLSDYVVYRNNNGSLTPTDSLFPLGMLTPNEVYVTVNPSASALIQAEKDTAHTLTFYNGDDAVWLKKISTGDTLDVIGVIGVDPGTGWPVSAGATNNFTLIRKINIQQGSTLWSTGATEWDVYPIDMDDSLGTHTMIACCNSSTGIDTRTECNNYTWIDGANYTADNNTATFNIVNGASNGCDSLVTLDLTIINSATGTDTRTECNNYTWIDGTNYTADNNTATFNIVNGAANGCDSLVTLDLTIINSATGTDTRTECNNYTWIDGTNYTADNNTATFNIVNGAANGCDSLVTLDLTIINSATGTDTRTECNNYTWIDGTNYTADNNTATFNIVNGAANGCDSLVTLDLTINNVNLNTTLTGSTITSNSASAAYQWIDCNNSNAVISGETNINYTATVNGDYAVIITENNCTDTSDCVTIAGVGINENQDLGVLIYPNPNNGEFTISTIEINISITIYSTDGKMIINNLNITGINQLIDLSDIESGIYYVKVTNDHDQKTIRLVIE